MTCPVWAGLITSGFVRWNRAPTIESAPLLLHRQAPTTTRQTCFRVRSCTPRPAGTMGLPGDAQALRSYDDPLSDSVMGLHSSEGR